MNGLSTINIELTSRCNKKCWMCGRRKEEQMNPNIERGDMDFGLLRKIAKQIPPGVTVQLHNNGEPLLYPQFGMAVDLFQNQLTNIVTNGKLLMKKFDEIVKKLDTLTVSIIQEDPEADEQFCILEDFIRAKGMHKPLVALRFLGNVNRDRYKRFHAVEVTRILHSPMGSRDYERPVTKPEIGVCLDFLYHPAINYMGEFSICVRFDPERKGVLGNLQDTALTDLWHNEWRLLWLGFHLRGERKKIPLCSECDYWGVPTGRFGNGHSS